MAARCAPPPITNVAVRNSPPPPTTIGAVRNSLAPAAMICAGVRASRPTLRRRAPSSSYELLFWSVAVLVTTGLLRFFSGWQCIDLHLYEAPCVLQCTYSSACLRVLVSRRNLWQVVFARVRSRVSHAGTAVFENDAKSSSIKSHYRARDRFATAITVSFRRTSKMTRRNNLQ